MPVKIEKFLLKNDWSKERTCIVKDYWYIKNLVDVEAVDCEIDLMSLDLSVMPWDMNTIGDFIGHIIDMRRCEERFPIIVSPQGWIMNGWHRVVKALLDGKPKIKARRIKKLPLPDGRDNG